MITALVLVGGLVTLSVLGAMWGADSRDRRFSLTRPPGGYRLDNPAGGGRLQQSACANPAEATVAVGRPGAAVCSSGRGAVELSQDSRGPSGDSTAPGA